MSPSSTPKSCPSCFHPSPYHPPWSSVQNASPSHYHPYWTLNMDDFFAHQMKGSVIHYIYHHQQWHHWLSTIIIYQSYERLYSKVGGNGFNITKWGGLTKGNCPGQARQFLYSKINKKDILDCLKCLGGTWVLSTWSYPLSFQWILSQHNAHPFFKCFCVWDG